jgi:L-threonylcarbamoyladenylate synthase
MSGIYKASEDNIIKGALVIKNGGLVSFPTETVYGLGASIFNPKAVAGIFEVKGRPSFNPLISHIAKADDMREFVKVDERALELAKFFWPGPLTFVLPRIDDNPSLDLVCAGLKTMTVRCPNHSVALKLIEKAGVPIAAPSANRSQTISPTTAEAVYESLGDNVDMILDGGQCEVGVESTILDLTTPKAVLLRAGGVTKEQLEEVLGEEVLLSDGNPDKPTSPGQMLKHYAPSKKFRINATEPMENELYIGFGSEFDFGELNLSKSGDLREAASNLFSFMRMADKNSNYDRIAMAPIPNEGVGLAINDRIKRASR